MRFGEACKPYAYLLPALALFGVFTAYPILRSVHLSFLDYDILRPADAPFIGLGNYREALGIHPESAKNDQKAPLTLKNTLRWTIMFLPPYVLLPIPVAYLIDRLRRGQAFLRVVSFLPIVVSGAVISVLWLTIYHATYGPMGKALLALSNVLGWLKETNVLWAALPLPLVYLGYGLLAGSRRSWQVIRTALVLAAVLAGAWLLLTNERFGPLSLATQWLFGLSKTSLLGTKSTAMPALVLMSTWHGFGFNVLMYLVTLANIPPELYEAAAVDGATGYRTFWNVSLPLLRPAVYLVTVLGTIGSLKVFGPMFIMTAGGPENSTVSVVQYIYQTAFTSTSLRFGYAASLAFLLAIVILAFAVAANRFNRPVDR